MFNNYFVWLITTPFSASDWIFEGRFCCIIGPMTLTVSPLSHYRGKEVVVPFSTLSWQV